MLYQSALDWVGEGADKGEPYRPRVPGKKCEDGTEEWQA